MNFDIAPQEVPVTIGKEDYVLVEATEAAAITWRNASLRGVKLSDGKIVGMDGTADIASLLVSLCLHKDGVPVKLSVIRSWPQRVVKQLFEKAKEISELYEINTVDEIDKEIEKLQERRQKLLEVDAKKSQGGGTDSFGTPPG